jgi:ABC-2 type transport system permease protein
VSSWVQALVPYAEFSRVGFVNILAFRLRYFTGIITYFLNVTVYYFIWSAVYSGGLSIAGYNLAQMITYVSVGWMIRSFYWNTIDQEMAYEVIEGKIAMDLIKPVSVQWMWISRAIGESAFRLGLLTLPTAVVVALVFPVQGPASRQNFLLFLVAVLGSSS